MTVSDQIIAVLNDLCAKFGIAIDWTQDNVFPYIEQLMAKFIRWEIGTSIFWMCFMSLTTLIIFLIAKGVSRHYKKVKDDYMYDDDFWDVFRIVAWIVFGVFSLFTLIVIGCQCYDIITCITFPEMKIIETIKSSLST